MRIKSQVYWKDGQETIRVGSVGIYSFVSPEVYNDRISMTYSIPRMFDKAIEYFANTLNINKYDSLLLLLSRGFNSLGYEYAKDETRLDEIKKGD